MTVDQDLEAAFQGLPTNAVDDVSDGLVAVAAWRLSDKGFGTEECQRFVEARGGQLFVTDPVPLSETGNDPREGSGSTPGELFYLVPSNLI